MKNYGLVIKPIQSDHYVLGAYNSLPKVILQPDGQWSEFKPTYECQADKYETWACPIYGTQNAYEFLFKRKFGKEINADERYNYNCIELDYPGGDPHEACQSVKNDGLTFGKYPVPDTFEEYKTPRPVTEEEKAEGRKWNEEYRFYHEWVNTDINSMKEALMYSPLAASVTAWFMDEDGLYEDRGLPNNHWCVIYGYYESNGQVFWKVFDSYDHSEKILHPNHKIQIAKRFHIEKVKKLTLWQRFLKWIEDQIALINYINGYNPNDYNTKNMHP